MESTFLLFSIHFLFCRASLRRISRRKQKNSLDNIEEEDGEYHHHHPETQQFAGEKIENDIFVAESPLPQAVSICVSPTTTTTISSPSPSVGSQSPQKTDFSRSRLEVPSVGLRERLWANQQSHRSRYFSESAIYAGLARKESVNSYGNGDENWSIAEDENEEENEEDDENRLVQCKLTGRLKTIKVGHFCGF